MSSPTSRTFQDTPEEPTGVLGHFVATPVAGVPWTGRPVRLHSGAPWGWVCSSFLSLIDVSQLVIGGFPEIPQLPFEIGKPRGQMGRKLLMA